MARSSFHSFRAQGTGPESRQPSPCSSESFHALRSIARDTARRTRTGSCEIELGGRKLVGSAQRRYGNTFLQHGSVLLGVDPHPFAALFPTTVDPLATLTTLESALGHQPKFDDVAAGLAAAFEAEHRILLRPDGLTTDETALADRLVGEKYATAEWLTGPL